MILLGSTGSIGTQALEVARQLALPVTGLAAGGSRLELLAQQAAEFQVPVVAVADPAAVAPLKHQLAELHFAPREILSGPDAATELAARAQPDQRVLNGMTGAVGLEPTLAALATGATLALANKESLVVGGALVVRAARPGQVIPVDSEHSAIFQALTSGHHGRGMTTTRPDGRTDVARLILTASGGPFRGRTRADLINITPQQALAHPTWDMGPVVTINSSTLMNKGLELIEAYHLFDVPEIAVVVHPQSMVHSLVEFTDGATLAQISPPDMRLPIALGLTWPERRYAVPAWDPSLPGAWTFEPVDSVTFPAVELARAALAASGTHPAVMNAANEEAVAAFLGRQLPYLGIVELVTRVVEEHDGVAADDVDLATLHAVQEWARRRARELIGAAQ